MRTILVKLRNRIRNALRRRRSRPDMLPLWAQAPDGSSIWEDRYAEMRRILAVTMALG